MKLTDIVNCWPTPSNDGTCDVNIEYELENEGVVLHDVVISIPLPYVISTPEIPMNTLILSLDPGRTRQSHRTRENGSWSRVAVWMNSTAAASLWWRVPG